MTWGILLLILLVVLVFASIPAYPYSREWGYAPMGGLSALLIVFLLLVVMGVIPISIDNVGDSVNIDLPNIEITDPQ